MKSEKPSTAAMVLTYIIVGMFVIALGALLVKFIQWLF